MNNQSVFFLLVEEIGTKMVLTPVKQNRSIFCPFFINFVVHVN